MRSCWKTKQKQQQQQHKTDKGRNVEGDALA